MTEALLQEVDTLSSSGENPEQIEESIRENLQNLARAIEGSLGSVRDFERVWRHIVRGVAGGETAEIHAVRDHIVGVVEKKIRNLKLAHAIGTRFRKLYEDTFPDPDVLLPEIAGMERLKVHVFDKWQTAEDLEDLAARDYPLSTADLERIGPQRPPPASWYSDENIPF